MIMVSVVVIGMGTDYALYLVRSYQRYMDEYHPSLGLIRLSVFMSFATTFLGFGVLAISGHVLLRSVGLGLALGIGYSYLGAVAIVPPLLKLIFRPAAVQPDPITVPGSGRHRARVMARYRHMEAYPRLYARFKMRFDPLYPRLADLMKAPCLILDIGCGYGLASAWLLELYPSARVHAVDPEPKRVLFASRVIGKQGVAVMGRAPDLHGLPDRADMALLLDVIHLLTDDDLHTTLRKLHDHLDRGGLLFIRVQVPQEPGYSWQSRIAAFRYRVLGLTPVFRSQEEIKTIVSAAGFKVAIAEPDAPGRDSFFLTGLKA